jgi:HK97 family phage major capsid protein
VTPRVAAPLRRKQDSSFGRWRGDGVLAPVEERAFWNYLAARGLVGVDEPTDPLKVLANDERRLLLEQRVLSKAASGGGFLVPTELADRVISAARAAGALSRVAAEFVTEAGETFNVPLAGTHGTAAWLAESGSDAPSDETITQAAIGAHKSSTKLIASEELLADESVWLDDYLVAELGARLGVLQENAFVLGDGSGKPLGITHASSGYTVVTAATGSATSFKLADIKGVFRSLPPAYRANATWLTNGDDFAELAALTDTAGGPVLPSLHFDPPSLFGRPVLVSADLPAPAANAKSRCAVPGA